MRDENLTHAYCNGFITYINHLINHYLNKKNYDQIIQYKDKLFKVENLTQLNTNLS